MDWARLDGTVAVVTGGNAGIGLGIATGLARAGAQVAILGRRTDRNEEAVREVEAHAPGARLRAYTCDVADEEAVRRALSGVVEELGRLDSCFANAGMSGSLQPALSTTSSQWRDVLGVNLDGAYYTAQAAAELMRAHGEGGSIVFTSSIAAFHGAPLTVPYSASKGAVLSLMRSLAVGLARDGIRVNAVVPGWIDTDMTTDSLADDTASRKILSRIPLRRLGRAEDLEAIAVLLAGSGSTYLTGQALVVDGGYSIF